MENKKKLISLITIIVIILLISIVIIKTRAITANRNQEGNADTRRLENKYEKEGTYDVGYIERESDTEKTGKYSIWYPKKLESTNEKYAVIIIANGTGAIAETHKDVFVHLASWGFIVIGNDDKNSWTGESSSLTLDYIIKLNNEQNSIFYNKVDLDKIGISGHSQGGVGAINAITNYENSKYIKSIYTASCACLELSNTLGWDYNVEKINIPYFMIAGTGDVDAGLIAPLDSLEYAYNKIESKNLTVMGRRKNLDHREVLKGAKGYMTAWFLTTLYDDNEAKGVFYEDRAEITKNAECWQDVRIKNN